MATLLPTTDHHDTELTKHEKTPFTLCVFCGSSSGVSPQYETAAVSLAKTMHAQQWSLVYGGGSRGLMGILAKTLVRLSGPSSVHGVIPRALLSTERGIVTPAELDFGQTTLVWTMHERKAIMAKEADAFVAMPGGFGTIEELFEAITWSQLGIHDRPVVLWNIDGFFDDLLHWVDTAARKGFVADQQVPILAVARSMDEVMKKIRDYQPATGRHQLQW